MIPDHQATNVGFSEFVSDMESRLRQALTSALGPEFGREAAAEALAYGWEHWARISEMENPVGYLFRVGQRSGRRMRSKKRIVFPAVVSETGTRSPRSRCCLASFGSANPIPSPATIASRAFR